MIFDNDKVWEIQRHAVARGLHDKRDLLLYGIDGTYIALWRVWSTPADQLLSDLQRMSLDGRMGDKVPIVQWLQSAAHYTKIFPEGAYFGRCAQEATEAAGSRTVVAAFIDSARGFIRPPASRLPTALDAAARDALVAAIVACFGPEDVMHALRRCFGDLPLLETAGQTGALDRDGVLQSLAFAERGKLASVFALFLRQSHRSGPAFRAASLAAFPELAAAELSFAEQVGNVSKILARTQARLGPDGAAQFAGFREAIAEFRCCKELHEAVHQAAGTGAPAAPAGKRPEAHREYRRAVRQYRAALGLAHEKLELAVGQMPPGSSLHSEEGLWIKIVEGYAARLQAMVDRPPATDADKVFADVADGVARALAVFNDGIVKTAKRVLDGPLVELREAIAADGADPNVKADAAQVDGLIAALKARVIDHARWQEADSSMGEVERALRPPADATVGPWPGPSLHAFAARWTGMRTRIAALTVAQSSAVPHLLPDLADLVDKALATSVNATAELLGPVVREPYEDFRAEAQDQFLRIDAALKRNCFELGLLVQAR